MTEKQEQKKDRTGALGLAFMYVLLFGLLQLVVGVVAALVVLQPGFIAGTIDPAAATYTEQITESITGVLPWSLLISSTLTVLIAWGITRGRGRTLEDEAALRPMKWSLVAPTLFMGVGLSLGLNSLLSLPFFSFMGDAATVEAQSFLFGSLAMALVVSILIPITEELLFRGFILMKLYRHLPPAVAIILQAVAFGMLHGTLTWGAYAALLGVLLAWVVLRTRSVYAGMLMHIGINATSFIMASLEGLSEPGAGLLLAMAVVGSLIFVGCVVTTRKLAPVRTGETEETEGAEGARP